jgi:hypothetical protein
MLSAAIAIQAVIDPVFGAVKLQRSTRLSCREVRETSRR